MMRILSILGILCFFSLSINAQIRVLNDEKKWIILMPDGSWHYDEPEKKATPTPAETMPPANTNLPAAASQTTEIKNPVTPKNVEVKQTEIVGKTMPTNEPPKASVVVPATKVIVVDGVEKIVPNDVIKKDTLPKPPAGMEYKVIIVDGVEKAILVQSAKSMAEKPKTVEKEGNPSFEGMGTIIPNPPNDSTKAVVRTDGSEQLTPEDEYRLKTSATQAGTKQDENIKIKPEKVKPKKQGKLEKPEKVVVKEVKKPKPAANGCDLAVNEIDEFTGKERKSTKARVFFTHTPEAAKKYMRADDYLTCSGYLSRVGSYKTLTLNITIDTPYGQTEYGEIGMASMLVIRMIDGSTVELYCDKGDPGHIDKIKNQTTYTVLYIMESGAESALRKGEVSRARLVWSVGFEDYELYNLDFFKEQLGCIN